ncbi:hypothetical protein TWF730_004037 [Orbilia blumenaviensis]|uniref:Post-GPI attachment to proteins factor 3 n=1 Tax=Orbilia blumenaviensis TaxID=1796055 RepID=A0AAV9U1F8_9PEZI
MLSLSSSSSPGKRGRTTPPVFFLLFVLLVALFSPLCSASTGDELPEFKNCVQGCIRQQCDIDSPKPLPLHLRLLFWNCPSECDYVCQRRVTHDRIERAESIEQFHGKWPFYRVLGVQEPFSVIFSILNGMQFYRGLHLIRKEFPSAYPPKAIFIFGAYVGMAAWFFSAVFHTRDSIPTERLDYFAAGGLVLFNLFYAPIVIFRPFKSTPTSSRSEQKFSPWVYAWAAICIIAYISHVSFLQFIRFDYTYNMAANVVVGLCQNLLWLYYSFTRYDRERRPWAFWPGFIVVWMSCAMSLELLDFPPLFDALDAHSLWHAATIMPAMWMYRFLAREAKDDVYGKRLKM